MKIENTELNLHLKDSDQRLFEGWYFKIVDCKISLAIIVGISKTIEKSCAFIQTLDTYTNQSQMIEYSLDDFQWGKDPCYIRIKNNFFTKEQIILDLDNGLVDIQGNLKNSQYTKLETTCYAPTIMGPFHYLPFLECNHAIISLRHHITGSLKVNNQKFQIIGDGYIEKDWGRSFPQDYLWLQSNSCKEKEASLFLSIAKIPLLACSFQGLIMNLLVDDQQIRVATYYGARVKDMFTREGYHYLIISQHPHTFYLKIKAGHRFELKSPQSGKMNGYVEESLNALAVLLVYKKNKKVAKFNFINCGFELFGNWL